MAAGRGVSAPAVLAAGVGVVAVYAGMTGTGLADSFRHFITGTAPTVGHDAGRVDFFPDAPSAGLTGGVAAAAQAYVGAGHVYRYGGASPAGWDCSGFVNWVVGHDLNLPIIGYPHGGFTGRNHGPVTGQWYIWPGCVTIARSSVQPGDIMVWPGHMGIAISNTEMVSCPGPNGTPAPVVGRIDGGARGPLACRRLKLIVPPGAQL